MSSIKAVDPLLKVENLTTRFDISNGFFSGISGRVHAAMPAPYNLEVPPHHFASNTKIIIGDDGDNI